MRKIRKECAFLSQNQRTFLSLHDGRHTLNEWIETAIVDAELQPFVDFIADFQMHHSTNKNVGKDRYRDKDILGIYAKIIDKSINFPLDLIELRQWEIIHGYKGRDENEVKIDFNNSVKIKTDSLIVRLPEQKTSSMEMKDEERSMLLEKLQEINLNLSNTVQRPKDMKVMDWTKARVIWQEQKAIIEQKLRGE